MEKTSIQNDAGILLSDFIGRAQYAKTEICREESITDAPPLLCVVFEPNEDDFDGDYDRLTEECKEMGLSRTYQCGMIPLIHKDDPAECLVDIIGNFPVDKFSFLFLITEGYRDTAVNSTDDFAKKMKDYERGDMAKEFAENPFTTITEVITVHGYDWDLTTRFVRFCDYKYDDKGVPVFGDLESHDDSVKEDDERGRIDEILFRGVQFHHLNAKAKGYFEKWDKNPNNLRKRKKDNE